MIDTKLIDLLPDDMPDEAAYYLINFMSELAMSIEAHYYHQSRQYLDDISRSENYNTEPTRANHESVTDGADDF